MRILQKNNWSLVCNCVSCTSLLEVTEDDVWVRKSDCHAFHAHVFRCPVCKYVNVISDLPVPIRERVNDRYTEPQASIYDDVEYANPKNVQLVMHKVMNEHHVVGWCETESGAKSHARELNRRHKFDLNVSGTAPDEFFYASHVVKIDVDDDECEEND